MTHTRESGQRSQRQESKNMNNKTRSKLKYLNKEARLGKSGKRTLSITLHRTKIYDGLNTKGTH